jgi:3-hydroxyisobutyrate dehydrogenase-like beta-hydroxyacid dehydrogenase
MMQKVGFIGLGTMGLPMVKNLLQAGFETHVVSRSRGPIDKAVHMGAIEAANPMELTQKVDVVLTCLPSLETVESVYFGEQGITRAPLQDKIVIDHSTISPALNRKQQEEIAKRGGSFLDAPLSGGPMGAEAATLTIMCGGKKEAFERALPVLQAMGKTIELVGDVGSGSVVKLINNLLVGIHATAFSEALMLGAKAGINPSTIHRLIKESTGHSYMIDRTVDLIQDRDFEQRFMVDLLHKDMKLAVQLAEELDLVLELGKLSEQIIQEVSALGYGKQDVAAIIRRLEDRHQLEVKRW